MIYYKIRNKTTGLYRKSDGSWNKQGKVYDTTGKIRSFLTLTLRTKSIHPDWEIVEFTVVETARKDPHEVMDPKRLVEILAKKTYS